MFKKAFLSFLSSPVFVFSLYLHVLTVTRDNAKNLQLLQYVCYCLDLIHLVVSPEDTNPSSSPQCLLDYDILLNQIKSELRTPWAHSSFLSLMQQPFLPAPPHSSLLNLLMHIMKDLDVEPTTGTILSDVLNLMLQSLPSQTHLITQLSISTNESVISSRSSDILKSIMLSGSAFLDSFGDDEKESKRVRTDHGCNVGIPFECVVCHSSHIDDDSHFPGYFCRYYRLPSEGILMI